MLQINTKVFREDYMFMFLLEFLHMKGESFSIYIEHMNPLKWWLIKELSKCETRTFCSLKGMNSYELVKSLRMNVPVNLAFNNQERLEILQVVLVSPKLKLIVCHYLM
jgi:hypothetical protein